MYPIQSAAKALFDAEQRQVIRITGVDKNGTPINITEANIMQDGFSIDRYSCNGKKLEIGTAIASELSLKLDNRLGQFDNIYFEGAELFVEIGVVNWGAAPVDWTTNANQTVTTNNGEKIQFDISNAIYWIPCGYYTPDEQPRRLSTISLKALDRMTKFDIVQHALLPWTDNNGNVMTDNELNPFYFCTELSFPTTIQGLVEQACFVCGVPLETDLSTLPGHNIAIASMPVVQGVITFRNLIQWCAGIMATNAWIDWDGKLRFSWYNNNTGYTSTIANRFDSDLYENDIQITGVVFTDIDEDKTLYIAGTDTYALDLSGNALISAESAQVILNGIYEVVHNYAYRPFTASLVTAPYLWPMDRVTFTDKGGSGHVTTLTNVNFTINNNTTIASVGETIQTNSYASPNSFTSEQASVLQKMRRVGSEDLHNAVDNATAQITGANGGYIRYIYDDNGILTEIVIMDTDDIATATKVWRWNRGGLGYSENGYAGPYTLAMTQDGAIVADFITAGTMSADLIRAGILTDTEGNNYWDLDNGIFRLAGNSTLGGTSVNQILSDVAATISSVDIEFAQNQSTTVAPTSGWSTDAPSWAAGYYIWQRTKTVSPSGVTYSEPTCISGRDGSASTPGLNQATIYLYQRAATQPSKPSVATTYTFVGGTLSPVPEGWYRYIPNGNEPCWVTLASAISTESTDNIPASEWVTPTKLVQDGANGSSVDTVVDYFAVGNTTTPPDDTEFWTAGVAMPWMDNYGNIIMTSSANEIDFMPPAVPVPTETDPYVWQYQLTTYTDGSTSKSSKYISSVLGETGVGVSDITEQYYLSTSDVAQVSGEWSTEQPVWVVGTFIWMRTIVTWTDGEVTITTPILAKAINGANTSANDAIDVANSAVEHTNNLDASLDQYGVFNRLTNNGEVQGIFLEDNKLYLNGTYMRTGILDASAVDVVNLNAANITTGTLDAARIGASTISISQLTNNAQTALVGGSVSKTQYYLSTSSSSATGGSWSDTVPTWSSGKYVWTRVATTVTKADGTTTSTTYSTAVYDANLTSALSTASTALSDANTAQSTADSAAYREQTIYISKVSGTASIAANTTWVADASGNQNTWTTKRPVYSSDYPVLFVATQRQTMAQSSGYTCSCTVPVIDQTTTVIDGGHITTGTIDAGVVNVTHINASNISAGTMSANYISGGTIDGNTVNAKQLQIVDGNNNVVASFNNVIMLGNTSDVHAEFDFNSLEIKDANGNAFVVMGDARNADGYFENTEAFTATNPVGGVARFTLAYNVSSVSGILSVTVNGNQISSNDYSVTQDEAAGYKLTRLNISTYYAPVVSGDLVVVNYKADEPIYRYDLGLRATDQKIGIGSVTEGYQSAAYGAYSHAEGIKCLAGTGCHAEGINTTASGNYSHAEGYHTTASGQDSHAEGSFSIAGNYAHAEGYHTTASGIYSHAEGDNTIASGVGSHAEGIGTISNKSAQHVVGRWNVQDPADEGSLTYIEIVGNGTESSRSNIRTLGHQGNEWIAGTLSQASDQRLKTETGEVPDVSDIKARRFKWNDKKLNHDDKEHIGYFAQDVEKVAPYLVDEDAMGYKSLDYNGILVAKIASLERRVAELEKRLESIRAT